MSNTRIIIDNSDGDIKSITSNQDVEVIIVDYDNSSIQNSLGESDFNQFIPGDLSDHNDPETSGVFSKYEIGIDEEYVSDVFEYVENEDKRLNYSNLVRKFYDEGVEEE